MDDRKTNFSRVYLRNGQNVKLDQVRSHSFEKWWNCRLVRGSGFGYNASSFLEDSETTTKNSGLSCFILFHLVSIDLNLKKI